MLCLFLRLSYVQIGALDSRWVREAGAGAGASILQIMEDDAETIPDPSAGLSPPVDLRKGCLLHLELHRPQGEVGCWSVNMTVVYKVPPASCRLIVCAKVECFALRPASRTAHA